MFGSLAGRTAALLHRRPYWSLLYTDGRVVNEWEGHDWTQAPKKGRKALRLYCPSGEMAEVGDVHGNDAHDRLFQFKVGRIGVGLVGGGVSRETTAYVIGCIHSTDGGCVLYAWRDNKLEGPLEDNANALQFEQIGAISYENLGMR